MFRDLIGGGSLFLKLFYNRVPFGKKLTWKGWAEIDQSEYNYQDEVGQLSWVSAVTRPGSSRRL